tara:strand:+ start:126 stop:461 length:336 start_codon:yes stop_codon:yes gene_type:complete
MRDNVKSVEQIKTNLPVQEASSDVDKQLTKKIVSTFEIMQLNSAEDMVTRKDFRLNESYPFKQVCYVGKPLDTRHIIEWVAEVKDGRASILTEDSDLAGFVSKYCNFELRR